MTWEFLSVYFFSKSYFPTTSISRDHTENTPKWKRLVHQMDSPMKVTNTAPNNLGAKRGQPKREQDDEAKERKKRKNGEEGHEQLCPMVEAVVQPH